MKGHTKSASPTVSKIASALFFTVTLLLLFTSLLSTFTTHTPITSQVQESLVFSSSSSYSFDEIAVALVLEEEANDSFDLNSSELSNETMGISEPLVEEQIETEQEEPSNETEQEESSSETETPLDEQEPETQEPETEVSIPLLVPEQTEESVVSDEAAEPESPEQEDNSNQEEDSNETEPLSQEIPEGSEPIVLEEDPQEPVQEETQEENSNLLTAQIVLDSGPVYSAAVPTISSLALTTSNESLNNSEQNLTASWTVSDGDGDSVRNITNWYLNGSSITVLNFYFEQINGTSSNNAHDYSGFGNDGTEDGPGYFSSGGHDNGGYYSFDEDKAIDVSDSSTLDTDLGDSVTVEAWVYFNSLTNNDIIITKGDSNGIISYALQLDSAAQNLEWIVNTTTEQRIASSEGLTTNQWIHYIGTYDGTTMSLYVNGTLQNSTAQSGTIADSSYGLSIGFSPSRGGSSGLFGRVDDVRVYNRSLSAKQISALYSDEIATLVSQETNEGDNWTFWIQGNDGGQDSIAYTSNQMIIDTIPVVSDIVVNTSLTDLNTTGENVTAHFTVTGDPGEEVSNVTNWYKNDLSLSQLFLTFNGVDNQTGLNGRDYSGYGNDLIGTGGTPTWSASGGRDGFGAYHFDEGDYLNVSVGDSLNEPSTNLTIAMWVNITAESFISDYQGILSKRSATSSTNHYSVVLGPFGGFGSQLCFESVPTTGGNRGGCNGANLDLNEWVHIAVTIARPNLTFYVNGQKNASTSYDYTMASNSDERLLLGTSDRGVNQNYAGWIDDVYISNTTFTDEQINVMYNERHDLIPLEATSTGESWYVNVTPNDNKRDGESAVSSSLVIAAENAAPSLSSLSVTPEEPTETQNLTAQVTFSDAVGQTGTLTWEWLINGSVVHSQVNSSLAGGSPINVSSSLDANNLSASDMVSVQVNATDGYLASSLTSSTIDIANYSSISITLNFNQSSYEIGSVAEIFGYAGDDAGSDISNTLVGLFRESTTLAPDGWQDGSFQYRQIVNITDLDSTTRLSEGIVLNMSAGSSKLTSCSTDLRVYNHDLSEAVTFNVLSDTEVGGNRRCELLTEVNLSSGASTEYGLYYGSTSPSDPGYATLALNRTRNETSIASSGTASACYSHFVVGRINDDNEGTYDDSFNNCAESPEWWAINWSSSQNITSIQFYEQAFGDGWIDDDPVYEVDYWNGSEYVNVTNILRDPSTTAGSNTDAYYNTYFNPISTESIRLRPYSGGGNTFTGLWELYVYQPLELQSTYSAEESLAATSSTGNYSLNSTLPTSPGVYEFKANISQSVFTAENSTNITVYQVPAVNSSTLNTTAYFEGNFLIQAVIEDDNIDTVGFEVYSPSGSVALSQTNATTDDNINWNSSNFTLSQAANYSYKVIATDVDGNQANSSTTRIDFITTSLNLDPSLVNISQNFSAYGYSNFTNGSNVDLVVVSVFLNGTQQSPSETWFNSSWSYRVPITVSEDGGNTVSDTSVSLTLDTQTLISNNKMNSDCSDLRISDYNGTEMNYWIQNTSSCNTSSTLFWVPINLTASTNTTIYAYYGNVDASSASNSSLVMQFIEDFESYVDKNDLANSAWPDIGINDASNDLTSSAAYEGSNGLLLNPGDGAGWDKASAYYNVSTFSKGTVIEWYGFEGDDNHYGGISGFTDDISQTTGCPTDRGTNAVGIDGTCSAGGGGDALITISGTPPGTVTSANYDREGWKYYRLVWDDTSSFWVDGVQVASTSSNIPDTALNLRFSCFPHGTVTAEPDKYCYYDEIVAYSNFTETSSSVGTEEAGWFTNGTGEYNITLIAPASNDQVPVLTRVVSKGFTGEASSTLAIGLSSDPTTDNSNLSISSTTPREQEIVQINATVSNIGTDLAASVGVKLYVDGVENDSTTLTDLTNGSSELVEFNWTAEFGNHSLEVRIDPDGLVTELIESNNNASTNVIVSRVLALNYTGPTVDFSRGVDNAGEDSLGEVSSTQELSSRIYSLYNDSLGIVANCSFYVDGSLIGTNESNATGNCVYGLDNSAYNYGEYEFVVNFTDIPSQTVKHSSAISDSRTLGIRVFNISTSTDNFYDGVGYVIGEMTVVNITVLQNDTLFDPEVLSIDLRGSAGGDPSFEGDLTQLSTGQYQYAALVNDTPAGGFLRWHIRVNESSQTIATAINQDVEVNSANGIINASIINASLDVQDAVNFTLQDAAEYVLDSRTVNSTNQEASNIRQNKNHSLSLQTAGSEVISFQLVELNETNNSIQAQIVADPSSENASNVSNLTQIVGFESFNYSFVNATISLPLPSTGRNVSNIQYCSQWNESAANCSSSWIDSGLDFTTNGTHFSFTVSNFSAYAGGVGFNSQLQLWDETDSSSFFSAGKTKYPTDSVGFFANYTNSSSAEPITSSCTITFDESPSGPFAMTYNASNQLHEYERTFSSQGSSDWDVSCSNANYDSLSETDSVTITATPSSGSSSSTDENTASAGGVSGGGGGGGGGSAVNPNSATASEVKVIESIAAGTKSQISDLTNEVIKKFEFTFTEDQSAVLVEIKSVAEQSRDLARDQILLPRRSIYHVAKISAYNIDYSEIERAIIEFEVERSWLTEKQLDPQQVSMYRNVAGVWYELPTRPAGERGGVVRYESRTPGFSYFIIAQNDLSSEELEHSISEDLEFAESPLQIEVLNELSIVQSLIFSALEQGGDVTAAQAEVDRAVLAYESGDYTLAKNIAVGVHEQMDSLLAQLARQRKVEDPKGTVPSFFARAHSYALRYQIYWLAAAPLLLFLIFTLRIASHIRKEKREQMLKVQERELRKQETKEKQKRQRKHRKKAQSQKKKTTKNVSKKRRKK